MQLVRRSNRRLPVYPGLFNTLFNDNFWTWTTKEGLNSGNGVVPAVNVKESDEAFDIELAVPGLKKTDFNIEVKDDVMTITAESQEKKEEKEKDQWTRREFTFNSFKRAFYLPDTVDAGKIKASYQDGILHIAVPKKEEAKPQPARTIKIS